MQGDMYMAVNSTYALTTTEDGDTAAGSDDETDEPLLPIPSMVTVNEVTHRTGLCDDPFSLW